MRSLVAAAILLVAALPVAAGPDGEVRPQEVCIPVASGTSDVAPASRQICASQVPPAVWVGGGAVVATLAGGGAWAWLAWLRWLPSMGLFTRLRSATLLEHPVRARVHEIIASEPGIHQQAIIDRAELGNGQASHHLATLARARIVTAVKQRGFTLYFLRGTIDAPVMHALAAVRSRAAVRALQAIAAKPGQSQRSVAKRLECSPSSLQHHVARFVEAGLVKDKQGLRLEPLGQRVVEMLPDHGGRPKRPPASR